VTAHLVAIVQSAASARTVVTDQSAAKEVRARIAQSVQSVQTAMTTAVVAATAGVVSVTVTVVQAVAAAVRMSQSQRSPKKMY
jgi:hypothetical protein